MKKQKVTYPARFKKIIMDAIEEYEKILEVREYKGDVSWMQSPSAQDDSDGTVLATCSVDHRYLSSDYRIFPELLERWKNKRYSDEEVKEKVAHEVAHTATHKLHWMAISIYKDEGETKDAWESLTEKVGRLVYEISQLKKKKQK